jgi:hypothetical protein
MNIKIQKFGYHKQCSYFYPMMFPINYNGESLYSGIKISKTSIFKFKKNYQGVCMNFIWMK